MHLRIIPSDARSGHRSISSIVLSTDCGIFIPYLASHLSRLDMSEWSTFNASRSTFDRGRSNEAADDGHSSAANGKEWKSSSVRLCRTLSAGSCCCLWLEDDVLTYWDDDDVGNVVSDVLCWQQDWPMNNNNSNRSDSIVAAAAARFNWYNTITTPIYADFSQLLYIIAYTATDAFNRYADYCSGVRDFMTAICLERFFFICFTLVSARAERMLKYAAFYRYMTNCQIRGIIHVRCKLQCEF